MKVIDPGHHYELDVYDSSLGASCFITFMKREGDGYPGNQGHYPGTNCQEVMRMLIDRLQYLDKQIEHQNNKACIDYARRILWLLEDRAAERHGYRSEDIDFRPEDIETEPHCLVCGHILCKGH